MSLLRTVLAHVPQADFRSRAAVESEIREELQFHLEMRTLDNLAVGMSPAEALRDARERFGDFEENYQACRRASLGARLVFDRLPLVLLAILAVAVVYLAVSLFQARADYRSSLRSLADRIDQLQQAQAESRPADVAASQIPYRQWEPASVGSLPLEAPPRHLVGAQLWDASGQSVDRPWSDWSALELPLASHDGQAGAQQ